MASIFKSKRHLIVEGSLVSALLFVAVVSLLRGAAQLRGEERRVRDEITEVRAEGEHYSREWEQNMAAKERLLAEQLPGAVNTSVILETLVTRFEKAHPQKVAFLSVNNQAAGASGLLAGTGTKPAASRLVRIRIKAEMGQKEMVSFFDQIEKFPEAAQVEEMDLASSKGDLLRMDMTLDFYVAPEEKKLAKESLNFLEWKPVALAKTPAVAKAKVGKAKRGIASFPEVSKLFGGSAVIDEGVYEEGDQVQGWTIVKIDTRASAVTFRKGKNTHKVVVR